MSVETISTVLVAATSTPPAGPYDLTDLATVHDELNLTTTDTSKDAFLSRAIKQASSAISTFCNRVFAVETLQDVIYIQQDHYPWQNPGLVYPLQLSRWPLVNGVVVGITGNTHGTTTVDGIASTTGLAVGMPITAADGSLPAGTTIASVGSGTITLSKAATTSVTGLALTAGVQVSQLLSSGTTQTLVYGTDFTIDAEHGWLIRLNAWTGVSTGWEAVPTTVSYQAGYSTIPDDLVDACLRLVTGRFAARGRDPMQMEKAQPGIGTQRFWIGQLPGQVGAMPPEIADMVEPYRVPVAL